MAQSSTDVQKIFDDVSSTVRGTGGAIAVVKDGKLVCDRTWGFADMERLIEMTKDTQIPICSISKHMLVLVIMDLSRTPTAAMRDRKGDIWQQLDHEMQEMLPHLFKNKENGQRQLQVKDLYNMQSGIRDYWAMTVLWVRISRSSNNWLQTGCYGCASLQLTNLGYAPISLTSISIWSSELKYVLTFLLYLDRGQGLRNPFQSPAMRQKRWSGRDHSILHQGRSSATPMSTSTSLVE